VVRPRRRRRARATSTAVAEPVSESGAKTMRMIEEGVAGIRSG
jgi:hypothetical protein